MRVGWPRIASFDGLRTSGCLLSLSKQEHASQPTRLRNIVQRTLEALTAGATG